MIFIFTALAGVIASELLIRLPLMETFNSVVSTLQKTVSVIRSSAISDHWKERVILSYSLTVLAGSLRMAFFSAVAVAPVALIGILVSYSEKDFFGFLVRPEGIAFITAVSLGYILVRRQSRQSQYGIFSKMVHHLALGNRFIAKASFDIEQATQKLDHASIINQKHVFVAGLARAATTVLMRRFYSSGMFRSLTYRDMPFVLMTNLWGRMSFSSQKQSERQERAHGDGLLVDYDSPEALEEVFWRVFTGEDYIKANRLIPMIADDESIERFQTYVASLLANSDQGHQMRYLSKNNNNILRLSTIHEAFPNALIFIPYRDPVQQAYSLLRQHQRFLAEHRKDRFSRRYMSWLGHHEFGSDHRPFRFGGDRENYSDTKDLNYWLELWLNTYSWLHSVAPDTAIFVGYESLCTELDRIWPQLAAIADIPSKTDNADAVTLKTRHVEEPTDQGLLNEANQVYSLLEARKA